MNKKLILAVLLSLFASASALLAGIFMLQQLKTTSALPFQVKSLEQQISNIDTTVDLSDVEGKYTTLVTRFNTLASDVEELQLNQEKILAYTDDNSYNYSNDDTDSGSSNNDTNNNSSNNNDDDNTSGNDTTAEKKETTVRLNLRNDASTDGNVIKTLDKGTKVSLLGEEKTGDGYTWVKVKTETGSIGWVAKKYVK